MRAPGIITLGLYLVPACLILAVMLAFTRGTERGHVITPQRDCAECGERAEWAYTQAMWDAVRRSSPVRLSLVVFVMAVMWPVTAAYLALRVAGRHRAHKAHSKGKEAS